MKKETYYKLIDGDKYIGVSNSNCFVKYQSKHNIILFCDIAEAQYIMCDYDDGLVGLYHADWMLPEPASEKGKYKYCDVIEISKDEFDTLFEVKEYDIPEPPQETIEEETIIDVVAQSTLDFVIDRKIKQMKNAVNNAISDGFEISLSDGKKHYFSMTTQDQLNLISLSQMADSGIEQIPYHADGELCEFFSNEDMKNIIATAQKTITEYTTYFNSLKFWIEHMTDINEINKIYFGIDIPADYQSEVLKALENTKGD